MDLRSIKYIDSNGNTLYAEPGQEIVCDPSQSIGSAEILKSGQISSYRQYDDGDEQAGRNATFLDLPSNNIFGNTNRFTDELGGQTYTNKIAIDWTTFNGSTVLGYYMLISPSNITWNTAIDSTSALSIDTFTNGWRLANIKEIQNILYYKSSIAHSLDYSPFNIYNTSGVNIWSSTTNISISGAAYAITTTNGTTVSGTKVLSSSRYLAVRTFTVTGTILS